MLDARRQQYLQAMGVDIYWRRELAPVASWPAPLPATAPESAPPVRRVSPLPPVQRPLVPRPALQSSPIDSSDLGQLRRQISACTKCPERLIKRKVSGQLNSNAPWLVIGIAPGVEASRHGQLVAGPTEQLQKAIFRALGLEANKLSFTSLVRCPATNNRRPEDVEIAACLDFLKAEIDQLAPKIILCFGSKVGQTLLDTDAPMEELRGRVHLYGPGQTPLVVTYHPDWLLRHPEHKPETWADLLLARMAMQTA